MAIKKLLFFSVLAVFPGAFALPVSAAEPLRFESQVSQRMQLNIQTYFERIEGAPTLPAYAGVDLNGDGIEEFIVRDSSCHNGNFCTYLILADGDRDAVEIGRIKARQLMLGKGYTAGVRDLLVSLNPASDFDYQLYVWEPQQSRYTIQSEGS